MSGMPESSGILLLRQSEIDSERGDKKTGVSVIEIYGTAEEIVYTIQTRSTWNVNHSMGYPESQEIELMNERNFLSKERRHGIEKYSLLLRQSGMRVAGRMAQPPDLIDTLTYSHRGIQHEGR